MTQEYCQGCGKLIEWTSMVVAVRYGMILPKVTHTAVTKVQVDYFHQDCPKAFRTKMYGEVTPNATKR